MEAKEVLSKAHAALIQCEYKRAIDYYEQLLQQVMATGAGGIVGVGVQMDGPIYPQINHKRRRKAVQGGEQLRREVLLGYANALASCDDCAELPVASALQVYRQLLLNETHVVDGQIMRRLLRNATAALVERVRRTRRKGGPHHHQQPLANRSPWQYIKRNQLQASDDAVAAFVATAAINDLDNRTAPPEVVEHERADDGAVEPQLLESCDVDPLLCGVCDDLLKLPVTAQCGHTFCRQCAISLRKCNRCPLSGQPRTFLAGEQRADALEKDVLISRLVDKWWGAELKVEPRNENARLYLDARQLDQALRCANDSLEQAPNGFSGLLIRSEVLGRLGQFQSSLADAENALRSRPTSAKAHYRRGDALSGLGLHEAALMSYCIGCAWERSNNNIPVTVRHDMTRLLHQLLMSGGGLRKLAGVEDDGVVAEPYQKRRKLCHSIQELVVSLSSDCEAEVGLVAEQYERQRKKRRKGDARRRDVFKRIRQYSYSSSEPADEDAFVIDEKAMAAFPEMNLFEQEHEHVEEEQLMVMPLIDINDLLERIFGAVEAAKDARIQVNKSLIEPSDFDCVLCYRPLWRPVVTPCGHTYCSICLDRCMDYRQQCPLCMSPIADALSLTKRNATLFLQTAMERFIPELCGRRKVAKDTEPSVPIFICTAAFPNVPCPLLVSEPRYRLMVRQAIESGERQFGMTHLIGVPTANGRQQYSEYGTMLDIRNSVLLENGWSILSTVGSRRFRVVTKGERDGYDTAKVEFICDSPIGKEKVKQMTKLHEEVFYKAICWFDSLPETYKTEIVKSFGRMPQPEDGWISISDGPAWTWWVIAILPLNQQLKGKIIAEINLEKRLKAIDKTLFTLQDRTGTRNGQRLRHVAGTGTHAAAPDAFAVNEVAVDAQEAIDCCQRTMSVAGTSSARTRSQLEEMPSPNQSTQFLL